jgi:hypothetical protein
MSIVSNVMRIDAELRFHGESYGWECRFIDGDWLMYGRRWMLHADALAEAEEKRRELEQDDWITVSE